MKQECVEALLFIGADLAQNNKVKAVKNPGEKALQLQYDLFVLYSFKVFKAFIFRCAEAICKVYPNDLESAV